MKVKFIYFMIICLCLFGCAYPHREKPVWDERIPLDDGDTEKPSLLKRLLSDDDSNYHFRKVRWGFSPPKN